MFSHFRLLIIPSQTIGLHYDLLMKNKMLVELCVRNYATLDSLVNPNHTITRIQYPIQLVVSRTIHHAQGFTLDCLVFDPISVTKHGFTYTTLFHIHSKDHLYLLSLLLNKNFYVDPIVA
jgi:hypothetical protein